MKEVVRVHDRPYTLNFYVEASNYDLTLNMKFELKAMGSNGPPHVIAYNIPLADPPEEWDLINFIGQQYVEHLLDLAFEGKPI